MSDDKSSNDGGSYVDNDDGSKSIVDESGMTVHLIIATCKGLLNHIVDVTMTDGEKDAYGEPDPVAILKRLHREFQARLKSGSDIGFSHRSSTRTIPTHEDQTEGNASIRTMQESERRWWISVSPTTSFHTTASDRRRTDWYQ